MLSNSNVQHRTKHFSLLLARQLSLIEREHSQNLLTHQKLENSIRRASNQSSIGNRNKISASFDHIYNEPTASMDYHNRWNNHNSNQKRRLSFAASSSSIISQTQTFIDQSDEFSEDTSSYISLRRRRFCTKAQRLPPIIKANTLTQQKRENKHHHWTSSFQQLTVSQENVNEPFTMSNEEISKPNLSELSPIERQVRSFLETLPAYKGVQHGFDSFAPASLYSNRAPVAIR